jgi:hypothetical protein
VSRLRSQGFEIGLMFGKALSNPNFYQTSNLFQNLEIEALTQLIKES